MLLDPLLVYSDSRLNGWRHTPGRVADEGGPARPSVLVGWDEFDICGYLKRRWNVLIYVANDVNLMTIYEHQVNFPAISEVTLIALDRVTRLR